MHDPDDTPRRVRTPSGDEVLLAALLSGKTEGIIEHQEALGQESLVRSEQLPVEGTRGKEELWLEIGVGLGPDVEGSLFRDATLPAGWRKVPTEHAMWSHLLDDRGRVRAKIFYKAAFYDQRADIRLESRFVISRNFDKDPDGTEVDIEVLDAGQRVHAVTVDPGPRAQNDWDAEMEHWREFRRLEDEAAEQCRAWLAERGYTEINDPTAYWDEA